MPGTKKDGGGVGGIIEADPSRGHAGRTKDKWPVVHFKAGLALTRYKVVGARAGQRKPASTMQLPPCVDLG